MIFKNREKGVSLIITFFILTIILAVVISISTLLYGQVKITRNIGNSVVAFYAADSGVEKVLYYDRKQTPADGIRGLCYMFDPNNLTACPSNCTPGINGNPGDCVESDCQGYSITGINCNPLTCTDCEVSFNSFFEGKSYEIKMSVISGVESSTTNINSKGNYQTVSRKIQLQMIGQ